MEEWKNLNSYEDTYEISSFGRLRSKTRKVKRGNHEMIKNSKILSLNNNGTGYLQVHLYRDGKREVVTIHRLVALHFIPNDDPNKIEINHIDEDKSNNRVSNLEWCTKEYNANHGTKKKSEQEPHSERTL